MVGDLVAILDDRGISKARFFGYSMGGRIGFRIPLHAPDRFSALILGGATYPIHGDEDAKDEILARIYLALDEALKEAPNDLMAAYLARMEAMNPAAKLSPARRAAILSNDAIALQAVNLAHRRAASPSAEEALPRFTMPCLTFVGEADPRYAVVKECAERMPNASFTSFPRLDHVQTFMRSDLVLPYVKRFLASTLP